MGHGRWHVLTIIRCSRLCCSFDELLISRALFRLSLHMMAPGPGFLSRAMRFAWARLSVTADVEGQCLEESEAYRETAQARLLIKGCCKIMSATLLRYHSVLVSAGWPGEIIFCVGYTCVQLQSVLWNTTRSL